MGFGLGFGILFLKECIVIDLSHTTLAVYSLKAGYESLYFSIL
jgi:hypothetical protein